MQRKYRPFLSILGLGLALAIVIVVFCLRTLESDGDPAAMTRDFDQLQGVLTWWVPLIYALLLVVQARAYLRKGASGWFFFLGWLYLLVFTAIDYMWLSDVVFRFTKETGTWQGGFNAMGVIGVALAVAGGLLSLGCYMAVRSKRRAEAPVP